MEQPIKDLIKEINVLEIKSNQTLVVKLKYNMYFKDATRLQQDLASKLHCNILVLNPSVDLEVIDVQDEN